MNIDFIDIKSYADYYDLFEPIMPPEFNPVSSAWNILGAVNEEEEAMGVIGYTDEMSQIDITWLYVDDNFRRKGVAKELVYELIRNKIRNGFVPEVACDFNIDSDFDENSSGRQLYEFFMALPCFNLEDGYFCMRVDSEEISKSKEIKKIVEHSSRDVYKFSELDGTYTESFNSMLEEADLLTIYDYETYSEDFIDDLCLACAKDGKVNAVVMAHREGDDVLISYLQAKNPKATIDLMSVFFNNYLKNHKNEKLTMIPITEAAEDLYLKLFHEKMDIKYIICRAEWTYDSADIIDYRE